MDINEDILNGIWFELMTMNALRALTLVHNPCLSPAEREFVAGVANSVIEAEEDDDEDLPSESLGAL